MLRFQSLQTPFFFFFLGRCSEGSLPRGLIHVSSVRKGGHFPHILDPSFSACEFLLCNGVFPLGWSLIFCAARIQTELFDSGEGGKSPANNPYGEIQVAPASERVCYLQFLPFYKVQMENVTLENGTPPASAAP